ncbi:c-type cytochrome [Alteromonas oceanisediminis]|uniref:c-type cytochrome n=1 Tax=Alteromonas oceanisediminis TaxID=2836180 RepID=UPI001BDAFE1F|nr:cytochrome c [Alteromonas oceanisediminis]MBT0588081.1 cytochrome c [Alteromonas oceanisediminis]
MKKSVTVVLAAGLSVCAALSTPVMAEPATSEKQAANTVQFRQALLQLVRSNMGPLGAMAKGHIAYDENVMKTNGLRIEQLSMMMTDYFATDTSGFDVETDALPKIWQNMTDFEDKVSAMTKAAEALQIAASSADEGRYRSAIGELGASCKGCHDEYKKD